MNDMASAPRDIDLPILLLARWHWSSNDPTVAGQYRWLVAEYDGDGGWSTVTTNPYCDNALDPLGWLPLPEIPSEVRDA